MLNVPEPSRVMGLEIVSVSVLEDAADVTLLPLARERLAVPVRDRMNADVDPVAPVLAKKIESTFTGPPRLLVDVVAVGLPR
jgi:hypothetical protein